LVTLFIMTFVCECFQGSCTFLPGQSEKSIPITTLDREALAVPAQGLSGREGSSGPTVIAVGQEALPQADSAGTQSQTTLTDVASVSSQEDTSAEPDEPPVLGKSAEDGQGPGEGQGSLPDESLAMGMPAIATVPAVPNPATVTTKLHVPEEPFLFEPMVLSEEEFDMFFPVLTDVQQESDDFFADFFVVGADSTIAYEDGLYYLGLLINGDYVGDIEVKFEGETQFINTLELSLFIGDFITKGTYQRLFGDNLPFLSIEEINNREVEATYDSAAFTVSLEFGIQDMPERSVSVTATTINRREQYGISGAILLKPANFSIASSLSLYTLFDYMSSPLTLNNALTSLSFSNRASVFGVGINFSFSLSSSTTMLTPTFVLGSWNGFYDFVELSQRLSFGNVGSSLSNRASVDGSTGATPFGLQLEKNYSYGSDKAKGNQFEYRIVLVEPSEIVISVNNNELFRRTFQAGTYRLKDFVFTQGANIIKIVTIPSARPDDAKVEYVDMGYDYRLLGKGDTVYGVGITIPKVKSAVASGERWTLNLPWYQGQYLSYHLDKFTANYWQQIGLTNTFTLSSDIAYSPGTFSGMVNGVFASMIGTTQAQLTLGLDDRHNWFASPSISGALSHRFSGKSELSFGTLNVGVNFFKPYPALPGGGVDPPFSLGGNLSYSGNFSKEIRYTLSATITQSFDTPAPAWTAAFSTGFSPFKGMSLSGSLALNALDSDPLNPAITAQITGSYSFSQKLNASASTSQQTDKSFSSVSGTSSVGITYRPTAKDSLNLNLSGLKFDKPLDHSLVGGWSHNGDLSSFSLRQQSSDSYRRQTTTFTANTAFAYADGAFSIAKSVNEAFFMVKPVGELKKAKISVARSLDASPTPLITPFGSALYNNISTNIKNSIVVFSTGSTDYSSGTSFVYELNPRSRQAFVTKIDIKPSFTISGLLFRADKSPYEQYSSPVYALSTNEEGQEEMTRDDALYLFTDQDGRFIISDVLSGDYLFDLRVDDLWYSVRFTVPEVEAGRTGKDRVLLLEDFWVADPAIETRIIVKDAFTQQPVEEQQDVFGTDLVTGYDASVTLRIVDRIDEESFWKVIFPTLEQDDWSFDSGAETGEGEFFFAGPGDPGQQSVMIESGAP